MQEFSVGYPVPTPSESSNLAQRTYVLWHDHDKFADLGSIYFLSCKLLMESLSPRLFLAHAKTLKIKNCGCKYLSSSLKSFENFHQSMALVEQLQAKIKEL